MWKKHPINSFLRIDKRFEKNENYRWKIKLHLKKRVLKRNKII